jgi:LPXTG-motif cell wall-anchored protein
VVSQKASNGTTQVVGSAKVFTAPASFGSTAATSTSENGSNLLILVVLGLGVLVIAGSGTALIRRRKAN